eukprot:scaffold5550_cov43-Prasinocladus_malaysianus.AAC.3
MPVCLVIASSSQYLGFRVSIATTVFLVIGRHLPHPTELCYHRGYRREQRHYRITIMLGQLSWIFASALKSVVANTIDMPDRGNRNN